MRVGRTMIDTDNMDAEQVQSIIDALEVVKARKVRAQSFQKQMNHLIEKAKEEGFVFLDKGCGFVREPDDFEVFDERE